MPESDLHLLALDGGGVRGLLTLQILKQLIDTMGPESPPKPCDYFDMIGGTSTSTGELVVTALPNAPLLRRGRAVKGCFRYRVQGVGSTLSMRDYNGIDELSQVRVRNQQRDGRHRAADQLLLAARSRTTTPLD